MGFWIFMLVMELLIPAMMLIFGWVFLHKPPKTINPIYGYRTPMSTKSQDTWDFAHHYFGRLWYRAGIVTLPATVLAMLLVFGRDEDTVGAFGAVLCVIECILMIAFIIPTEIALRKNFDKYGLRKS